MKQYLATDDEFHKAVSNVFVYICQLYKLLGCDYWKIYEMAKTWTIKNGWVRCQLYFGALSSFNKWSKHQSWLYYLATNVLYYRLIQKCLSLMNFFTIAYFQASINYKFFSELSSRLYFLFYFNVFCIMSNTLKPNRLQQVQNFGTCISKFVYSAILLVLVYKSFDANRQISCFGSNLL